MGEGIYDGLRRKESYASRADEHLLANREAKQPPPQKIAGNPAFIGSKDETFTEPGGSGKSSYAKCLAAAAQPVVKHPEQDIDAEERE